MTWRQRLEQARDSFWILRRWYRAATADSPPPDLTGLAAQLRRRALHLGLVDVGCRWGFDPRWSAFAELVERTGFDPDEDECRRLAAAAEPSSRARYLPIALGDRAGTRRLHVTRQPACSSFYRPSAFLVENAPALAAARVVREVEVSVERLDDVVAAHRLPRTDYLKVDVQGAELDVLAGAEATLSRVRFCDLEVEFNPIYDGQPLFGDVDSFLRRRGFVLWRLSDCTHYGLAGDPANVRRQERWVYDSGPVGAPGGGGQLFWAMATYVRAEAARGEWEPRAESALLDAAIAGALGFPDLSARAALAAGAGR